MQQTVIVTIICSVHVLTAQYRESTSRSHHSMFLPGHQIICVTVAHCSSLQLFGNLFRPCKLASGNRQSMSLKNRYFCNSGLAKNVWDKISNIFFLPRSHITGIIKVTLTLHPTVFVWQNLRLCHCLRGSQTRKVSQLNFFQFIFLLIIFSP